MLLPVLQACQALLLSSQWANSNNKNQSSHIGCCIHHFYSLSLSTNQEWVEHVFFSITRVPTLSRRVCALAKCRQAELVQSVRRGSSPEKLILLTLPTLSLDLVVVIILIYLVSQSSCANGCSFAKNLVPCAQTLFVSSLLPLIIWLTNKLTLIMIEKLVNHIT